MKKTLTTLPAFTKNCCTFITTSTGLRGAMWYRCEDPGDGREPFVRIRSDKMRGGMHDVPMSKIRKVEIEPSKWIDVRRADGSATVAPNPAHPSYTGDHGFSGVVDAAPAVTVAA